ncbi:MAG: hypothetical protein U0350_44010 [Caldilineaceae bacterium]
MKLQLRGLTILDRGSKVSPWLSFYFTTPLSKKTSTLHLLYVDESGAITDPNQSYFVLVGFSIFKCQGYWLSNQLDAIATRFNPADPASIELHGNPMLVGKGCWPGYSKADREQAID